MVTRAHNFTAFVHINTRFSTAGSFVSFRTVAFESTVCIHANTRQTHCRVQSTLVDIDTDFTVPREPRFTFTTKTTDGVDTLSINITVGHTKSTFILVLALKSTAHITRFTLAFERANFVDTSSIFVTFVWINFTFVDIYTSHSIGFEFITHPTLAFE
jgi:hypothetical protein